MPQDQPAAPRRRRRSARAQSARPGAPDHVRDIGLTNATDDELTNALNAPECRSVFWEEVRAEQRRRQQK